MWLRALITTKQHLNISLNFFPFTGSEKSERGNEEKERTRREKSTRHGWGKCVLCFELLCLSLEIDNNDIALCEFLFSMMSFYSVVSKTANQKADSRTCKVATRLIGHVRYINILAWLRGFRVKLANFSSFFCLSISKRDLDTKKTTPNIEVWPESLGSMLEY